MSPRWRISCQWSVASGRWPAMSCGCDFSPTFPIWVPLVAFVMSVTSAVASLARQFEDANLQDNWCSLVPRLGRLAESDGIGDGGVPLYRVVPKGRDIWTRRSVEARSRLNSKQLSPRVKGVLRPENSGNSSVTHAGRCSRSKLNC